MEEWEGDCDKDEFLVKVSGDYGDYDEADYNDLLAFLSDAELNGLKDARDEDEEWEEIDMMPCDYSGICAGTSCSMYWKC